VLILALDTCDFRGSVAVLRDDAVLKIESHRTDEDYSSWLLPAIGRVLTAAQAELREVQVFAAAAGPGSFTGVRVGLTTIKAWAEVYGRGIAAVSRLEGLAREANDWPENRLIDRDHGEPIPRVNVSIKLSSLYSQFDPIDPARASSAVRERLRPILRLAQRRWGFVNIDMESHALKDLTLRIFKEVFDEPEFRDLFPVRAEMNAAVASMLMAATNNAAPATSSTPAPAAQESTDGNRAHFAVVIDRKSQSRGNLDEAISSLGPWYQLLPNVWIISTEQTVNGVRNRLLQELGKTDSLFVIDASRGKAAWFNFGPEADVRIRRVWQKAS